MSKQMNGGYRSEVNGRDAENAKFRLEGGPGSRREMTRSNRSLGTYPNTWEQFKTPEVCVEWGRKGEL